MYPTKDEILEKRPDLDPEVIKIIKNWKINFIKGWKYTPIKMKLERLELLITEILEKTQKKNKKSLNLRLSNQYKYNPTTKTLYQNKEKPSIVSALHELAHHIYGPSELTACQWSVWLFKECFPGLYKNLKWKKHTLTK